MFLARDVRLERRVAIKLLQTDQPELTQRFLVEARATARCQHDNIVVIYDVGEHRGSPYIVLELLTGRPLTSLTQKRMISCMGSIAYRELLPVGSPDVFRRMKKIHPTDVDLL